MTDRSTSEEATMPRHPGAAADDWDDLLDRIEGLLARAGSATYEQLRKPVGQRFHHIRPAAVVRPTIPRDVTEAVRFAPRRSFPLAVRSGGHDFAGRSTGTGVVIDLTGLNRVTVDGTRVTVGLDRLRRVKAAYDPDGLLSNPAPPVRSSTADSGATHLAD